FSLTPAGIDGSLVQMINHGITTGALFLLIGMLYERYHTRKLSDYGGMAGRLPVLACFMGFMCLSSAGLPGLNGFVGEYLALSGIMNRDMAGGRFPIHTLVAASGVLLGAMYLFTMLWRVFFGPVKEPAVSHEAGHASQAGIVDLKFREWALLVPLAIL